jgi:NAD(P)-dependent dehydrogenase (short-subunit alcohol dehydrogenase family)
MGRLDGNVALVTGGGSGLGRAVVARFLDEGARIGVLDRSAEKTHQLKRDFGEDILVVTGDVRSYEDNIGLVEQAVCRFGRLDTFVGCAAVQDFSPSTVDLPVGRLTDAFNEVFHTSVLGYLNGAKACARCLAINDGNIILTVSKAGCYPDGGGPLHAASKHAVVGLIQHLALELAPKVRVNGVAPGAMLVDSRDPASWDLDDHIVSPPRLGEVWTQGAAPLFLPSPEDYTSLYVLLASKADARAITGEVINCGGGAGGRRR